MIPGNRAGNERLGERCDADHYCAWPAARWLRARKALHPRSRAAARARVTASDESVVLPQLAVPTLSLLANYGADHRVRLHWLLADWPFDIDPGARWLDLRLPAGRYRRAFSPNLPRLRAFVGSGTIQLRYFQTTRNTAWRWLGMRCEAR